jgi:hypothetical protein
MSEKSDRSDGKQRNRNRRETGRRNTGCVRGWGSVGGSKTPLLSPINIFKTKKEQSKMEIDIKGVKIYVFNKSPYFYIPFTEENAKKYIEYKRLNVNLDNAHQRAMLKMDMYFWAVRIVGKNNWRRTHGLAAVRRRAIRKRKRSCNDTYTQ